MKPSEQQVFAILFAYQGNTHVGMTAKEIRETAEISLASWNRIVAEDFAGVPGMKRCAGNRSAGAYKYFIDTTEITATNNAPVAVQEIACHLLDSIEWVSVSHDTRESIKINAKDKMTDARLSKLMTSLVQPDLPANRKAVAAQLIALHYLEQIKETK